MRVDCTGFDRLLEHAPIADQGNRGEMVQQQRPVLMKDIPVQELTDCAGIATAGRSRAIRCEIALPALKSVENGLLRHPPLLVGVFSCVFSLASRAEASGC